MTLVGNVKAASSAFMTSADLQSEERSNSGLSIENISGGAYNLTGVLATMFAYSGDPDCTNGSSSNPNGNSIMWTPVTLANNQSAVVGKNYLYNMLMGFTIYNADTSFSVTDINCVWFDVATANPANFNSNIGTVSNSGAMLPLTCNHSLQTCTLTSPNNIQIPVRRKNR